MDLSVILPSYNEVDNIIPVVNKVIRNIPEHVTYEILVVDDNSPDGTYDKLVNHFQENPDVRGILRKEDRGLANSIRAGIENSSGEYILVMDTDMTHDSATIPYLVYVSKMYDMVSGSRYCAGGNMEDKGHYYLSLMFNWFIRLVLNTQIQDNLGGYFIISRKSLLKLPFDYIFYGFGDYYFRLIHYAQRNALTVVEIPTIYRLRFKGKSKMNMFSILSLYLSSLISFRFFITFKDPRKKLC